MRAAQTIGVGLVALMMCAPLAEATTKLAANAFGIKVDTSIIPSSGVASVVETSATASGLAGFWATGSGAVMVLESPRASANVNGIRYDVGSTIRCHNSISIQNITADQVTGGTLVQDGHCQIALRAHDFTYRRASICASVFLWRKRQRHPLRRREHDPVPRQHLHPEHHR